MLTYQFTSKNFFHACIGVAAVVSPIPEMVSVVNLSYDNYDDSAIRFSENRNTQSEITKVSLAFQIPESLEDSWYETGDVITKEPHIITLQNKIENDISLLEDSYMNMGTIPVEEANLRSLDEELLFFDEGPIEIIEDEFVIIRGTESISKESKYLT